MYAYDLLAFDAAYCSEYERQFRPACDADVDAMLAIERESFEFPWSREEFEFCLHSNRCDAIVVERDGAILGYVAYELRRDSIRLLSCAIAEPERRRGLGSALVERLISRLGGRRSEIACLVRERNLPAQLFLRRLGFRSHWVARRFYTSAPEDAYRMTYQLDDAVALPSPDVRRAG
ncbi:MAG: GNAT family N-acetyltransferase [Thermoguttaceae bacterium]|nr:GNAT family N-acetyltransferase [Thermoguttaceae bacterium]MBQ9812079.1 GNAT family N-acetyltransferase [Thermoguttaceae bacterium]